MSFRFRLEKVARYRQKLVDEQSREVAKTLRVVSGIQARIAALDEDISAHLNDFDDQDGAVISVQGMMARTMWVSHLEDRREEFAQNLATAQTELARHRDRLSELWQDLEVLKKLREKQAGLWRDAQHKRDRHNLDEIGQIRADRQRRSKVAT